VADLKVSAATAAAMTDAGLFPASIGGADKSVSGSALKAFVGVYNGAGSPEGSIVGSVGDIWLDRTNGQVYEKRSGAATNTGWQLISYPRVTNGSTGSQGPLTASATTLLTGSTLAVPLTGLKALTRAYWAITMSKTAAGTLTNNFDVRIGTAQAIIEIWAHMRTVGAGTAAVIVGMMKLTHGLASTGWSTVPAVIVAANSSGFDSTVANLILSVSMTTAASTVPSVQAVEATLEGL
jgi:hypothetical protein